MIKIPVEIIRLNQQLRDNFGIDTITSEPIWRVSWAADQFEKRFTEFSDYTTEGIFIRTVTEIRDVPKYPWWKDLYILERLVLVPECDQMELLGKKTSYECLWPFHDRNEKPLPPKYEVCEFVIYQVYTAQYGPKYKNLDRFKHLDVYGCNDKEELQKKKERVERLMVEMFGDETPWHGDSVDASGSTILMPNNYIKES